jgi:hypothetical protein
MKFYKRLPINRKDPMDNSLAVEVDGRISSDSQSAIQIPAGDTLHRPINATEGLLRYNTDFGPGGDYEAYINGSWQFLKTNRQRVITVNTFNNGDYNDTLFGPLEYDIDPAAPQNLFVYVDNVYQIPASNYTLVRSSVGNILTTSTLVKLTAAASSTTLFLNSVADFNVGRPISGTNISGNVITAVSATSKSIVISPGTTGVVGSGTVITTTLSTGTFIRFSADATPVPSKPVTALQGFDGYGPPFIT